MLGAFPPFPAVATSGSPLTVARPFRICTGFLTRERSLYIRAAPGVSCAVPGSTVEKRGKRIRLWYSCRMVKREGASRTEVSTTPAIDVLNDFIERGVTLIGQHLFRGEFGNDNVHELGECTVARVGDAIVFEDIRNRKHVWRIRLADFELSQMDSTSVRFTGERDEYVLFRRTNKMPAL